MPYYPNYGYSHESNVVRNTIGKYILSGYDGIDPLRNNTQSDGHKKEKYWKEVTFGYFSENEAVVGLSANGNASVGLAVFIPMDGKL